MFAHPLFSIWIISYAVVSTLWLLAITHIVPQKRMKKELLINGGILTTGLVILIIEGFLWVW